MEKNDINSSRCSGNLMYHKMAKYAEGYVV